MEKFVGNTQKVEEYKKLFERIGVNMAFRTPAFDIHGKQLDNNYFALFTLDEVSYNKYNAYMDSNKI